MNRRDLKTYQKNTVVISALRDRRLERGYRLQDAAKIAKMSVALIHRVERGIYTSRIKVETHRALIKVYGADLAHHFPPCRQKSLKETTCSAM